MASGNLNPRVITILSSLVSIAVLVYLMLKDPSFAHPGTILVCMVIAGMGVGAIIHALIEWSWTNVVTGLLGGVVLAWALVLIGAEYFVPNWWVYLLLKVFLLMAATAAVTVFITHSEGDWAHPIINPKREKYASWLIIDRLPGGLRPRSF